MPSKTTKKKKKPTKPRDQLPPEGRSYLAELEEREAKRAEERKAERAQLKAIGLEVVQVATTAVAEQTLTLKAQRFAAYAAAAKDLATLGSFPAIDEIRQQAIRELTVMGRELHESRMAKVTGP